MAFILTNGKFYIYTSGYGRTLKTDRPEEAQIFGSEKEALKRMSKAPGKCKGYYPYYINKVKRKQYTSEQRKIIYDKGNGCCQLCGRKISSNLFTLDHITPLSLGGADEMENLQCTCKSCNTQKASFLPETFFDRITEIFMYQMDKRYSNNPEWKTARNILMEIL